MAGQFYYVTIDLTVKLNDKETVNRSCKKTLISDGLSMLIS